ncbi:MAG TPA: glycosyltransferase family 2 protein [Phycisphaerae bacterium]|nr:glycosyltransferase family 2 protein [Phycisphaerae bacterium]HOI55240.1 glycosyltransferase family 2 protein [Phycisphaerae bacterium]
MDRSPLVSIGVPVYNGERFLRDTLNGLLAQEFSDVEILISDNASTDGTEAIAREFAAREPRVTYCRNTENLGAARNFELLVERARGTYFIWASAHDRWDRRFLAECVAALRAHPEAVLCYSQATAIDESGQPKGPMPLQRDTCGMALHARYRTALWRTHSYIIYGLHRRDALRQVMPAPKVMGNDDVMLAELALIGPFVCVQERLFYFRVMDRVGDMRSNLRRLNLRVTWWNPPLLVTAHVRLKLAAIRRRVPDFASRCALTVSALVRGAKLLVGFTLSTWAGMCCPRLFASMLQALLRRRAAQSEAEELQQTRPAATDHPAETADRT